MLKLILLVPVLGVSLAFHIGQAQTFQWNQTAVGTTYDWNDPANWTPNTDFPNAIGEVANVNNDIVGNQTIRLQEAITIGTLNIGDAVGTNTFTIANEGAETFTLTFNNGTSNARISKTTGGSDTISALVHLAGPTVLNAAANTLTLSNVVSGTGPITKTGSGTINVIGSINDATSVTTVGGILTIGSATNGAFNGARFGDSTALDLAGGVVVFQGLWR